MKQFHGGLLATGGAESYPLIRWEWKKVRILLIDQHESGPRDPDGGIRMFYIPTENRFQQYVREYERKILQEGARKGF